MSGRRIGRRLGAATLGMAATLQGPAFAETAPAPQEIAEQVESQEPNDQGQSPQQSSSSSVDAVPQPAITESAALQQQGEQQQAVEIVYEQPETNQHSEAPVPAENNIELLITEATGSGAQNTVDSVVVLPQDQEAADNPIQVATETALEAGVDEEAEAQSEQITTAPETQFSGAMSGSDNQPDSGTSQPATTSLEQAVPEVAPSPQATSSPTLIIGDGEVSELSPNNQTQGDRGNNGHGNGNNDRDNDRDEERDQDENNGREEENDGREEDEDNRGNNGHGNGNNGRGDDREESRNDDSEREEQEEREESRNEDDDDDRDEDEEESAMAPRPAQSPRPNTTPRPATPQPAERPESTERPNSDEDDAPRPANTPRPAERPNAELAQENTESAGSVVIRFVVSAPEQEATQSSLVQGSESLDSQAIQQQITEEVPLNPDGSVEVARNNENGASYTIAPNEDGTYSPENISARFDHIDDSREIGRPLVAPEVTGDLIDSLETEVTNESAPDGSEQSPSLEFLGEQIPEVPVPEPLIVEDSIPVPEPEVTPAPTPTPEPTPFTPESQPIQALNYEAISEINGVNPELTRAGVHYYITEHGLTPLGASMLIGNFIQESSLNPNAVYEAEDSHGIGQWRFERLVGMPRGNLVGQYDFALMEMVRDGRADYLPALLRDPNATVQQIEQGLRDWERYGIKGNRTLWGQLIHTQLHS